MSKQIPEIRFKDFTDEWEQRKFEEIVDVRSGRDYKHLYNGDIPVYGTGGYMLSVDKALSYDEDAIGIGRKGTIDKPYLLKAPFWTVDTLFYSVPIKENNLFFINNLFQRVNWKRYDESTGVPSLSKAVINKISAMIPELDEQAKIGKFFKKLDETIALHQDAIQRQQDLKKAMLQKLFPINKATIPTVRFTSFSEEWEQRKLESISETTYGGGTPKTSVKKYWEGNFPWIQSSDLQIDNLNNIEPSKFITEEAIKNSATKKIPANSIAIVTRVGVGKLALMQFPYSTSQDFLSLSQLKIDDKFALYSLYNLLKKELNNIQGTSIKGITKSDLLDKHISTPLDIEEQTQIGHFFEQLDETITLHQQALEKLKLLKKSLLQKMFI